MEGRGKMKRLICTFIIVLVFLSGCANAIQTKDKKANEGTKNYKLSPLFILCIILLKKLLADPQMLTF